MSRLYVCMYPLHNLDMIYKNIALTNPWYYIIGWCKLAEMWWKNNKGRVWGEIMEWGWVCHPLKLTMWEKSIITPLQKTVVGGCVGSLPRYLSLPLTLICLSLYISLFCQSRWLSGDAAYAFSKNMENHALGFFMKNIVFHIYLGIVECTYTV